MEEIENKRARKSVNYTEVFGDSIDEDDFADFTPPPKKKKETVEIPKKTGVGDNERSVNGYYSDKEKKENRDDKDRKLEKERYIDDRDKKEKDRSRDKRDKDRDRHRDRDRQRHRRDDKYRDKQEKEKDREQEWKERSDLDRGSENKERIDNKDNKQYIERESEKETQDNIKSKEEKDSTSPTGISSSHPLASTQKSPNRATTTKRLSIEEKLFQRELDAALTLSKLVAGDAADFKNQPDERKMTVDTKATNNTDGSVCSMVPESKDTLETKHSISQLSDSVKIQDAEVKKQIYPISLQDKSATTKADIAEEETNMDLLEVKKLESNTGNKSEEPQPCTSAGITSKRLRKTVVFKEDTDSDSFDGFSEVADPDSDFSEGSDFALTPKKKTKERKATKNGKSPKSTTKPDRNKGSNQKCSPVRTVTTSATKENNTPQDESLDVVQSLSKVTPLRNSSAVTLRSPSAVTLRSPSAATPRSPSAATPRSPSAVTPRNPSVVTPRSPSAVSPQSPFIVSNSDKTTKSSSTFARGNSKITVDSKTVSSLSSPGVSRVSVGLVKTPFRSPLLQSSGNSSSSSGSRSSLGNNRNTGLRLGLSRRTNVTPLHPSVSGK